MLSANLTANYPRAFVPTTFSKGQPLGPFPVIGNNSGSLPLAKSSSYSEPFYPSALQVGGAPPKLSSNFSNSQPSSFQPVNPSQQQQQFGKQMAFNLDQIPTFVPTEKKQVQTQWRDGTYESFVPMKHQKTSTSENMHTFLSEISSKVPFNSMAIRKNSVEEEMMLEEASTGLSGNQSAGSLTLSQVSASSCSEEEDEEIDGLKTNTSMQRIKSDRVATINQRHQADQTQSSNKSSDQSSTASPGLSFGRSYQDLATIKRPKKQFASERDRDQFVKQYKAKLKTEMCRNWEITGTCYFKDTCSFAHGAHELVKKKHVPPNFKTKACVQFHETGFCPYGNRCQFLHSQFSIFGKPISPTDAKSMTNQQILAENMRLSVQRSAQIQDEQSNIEAGFFLDSALYVNVFAEKVRPRLRVFDKICSAQSTNTSTSAQYSYQTKYQQV